MSLTTPQRFRRFVLNATDRFYKIIIYYFVSVVAAGALFSYFEDKPIGDSLWWACVTALTIGYGDLYPVTAGGKVVAVLLMHIVPLIIIPLIVARLLSTVIEDANQFSHHEQEEIKTDLDRIKAALGIADDLDAEGEAQQDQES